MKKEYSFEELLHKAASYCSISEHCISEVRDKLQAWEVKPEWQQSIIEKLIEDDFINERRYCIAFSKDKFHFNKWGKIKITYSLKQKGINEKLISYGIKSIDEGEYEEMLAVILKSKLKTLKWNYEYEKYGKLFSFAQSRGFENAIIDRVIRSLEG